jgi:Flp pilus assembly pilin Flp
VSFACVPAFVRALLHDDGGQDVVEYALLTALFCLVALTAWTSIRDALRASYSGTSSGMNSGSLWATPDPTGGS